MFVYFTTFLSLGKNLIFQKHDDELMPKLLLTLPEHLRSRPVFGGVRVAQSFVFYIVSSVLFFVCLFFYFQPGVVSLFSIYELDSPSGIFGPSFTITDLCFVRTQVFDVIKVHIQQSFLFVSHLSCFVKTKANMFNPATLCMYEPVSSHEPVMQQLSFVYVLHICFSFIFFT